MSTLRDLQQSPAVDGRHFNLGAEAGFVDAHRNGDRENNQAVVGGVIENLRITVLDTRSNGATIFL